MEEGAFVHMIRFRLGKSKRLVAVVCALLLALEVVAFPMTQAKAAATAALTAVGFGVTTAAFLAACGIYPYWVDDSSAVNFDWEEWVDDDLMALVDEYNAANSTTPINPNQVSAFLSGATLLVGSYAWEKLRDFAEWIKTEYAVTDNQTGIDLGTIERDYALPYYAGADNSGIRANGAYLGYNSAGGSWYGVTSVSDAYVFYCIVDGHPTWILISPSVSGVYGRLASTLGVVTDMPSYSLSDYSAVYDGIVYRYCKAGIWDDMQGLSFSTVSQAIAYALTGGTFEGITADTTTVSIPDALPSDTEYGGLRVSGLPAATMAETVVDALQDSVGERLKTPVEVVDVELASGTEIDSETGAVTQNPVVIEAPVQETIPALSALAPSQEFVAAMMEALQTKFPFCLPFDFMRVLQAFVKPPDAPVITMEFHDRMGGGTYTITVDLEPWDDIAAVVRRLESMILFLGFWLNFDKFNVLNIILGQIG